MKKLERQKKAKKLAHTEEVEQMKRLAAEKGQGFVEYEIPPDEVDEDQVKRSLYTSIMTFIPYTNEYYEAMAAEEEMDDLGKIRREKVKVNDLYAMTKVGRHEEALQSMMAETNYDFFYFNKLKMKMEEEGKFKFKPPDNRGLFAALDSGPNRNRLRKAINQVYNVLDGKLTDELRRMGQVSSAGRAASAGKDFDGSEPCVWRGKNKNGDAMKCENHRLERPWIVDPAHPNRKKKTEFFQYCCYHVPFCVSDLHELGQSIKIKVPNDQALCAECFMLKNKKRPAALTADSVPGVIPVTLITAKHMSQITKKDNDGEDDTKAKEKAKKNKLKKVKAANPNQCPWQPTAEEANAEPALRKYECCNEKYKDEKTQFQYPHCIWHLRMCIRDHSNDDNAVGMITVPNAHGLCMMHYLAEFHDKPPNPPFPLPGMKFRRKKDFWKHDPSHSHWALPRVAQLPHNHRVPPLQDVQIKEYIAPEPPETMVQKSGAFIKLQFYKRRVKKEGKHAAIVIQKYFRGYRIRNIQLSLIRKIDQRELKARLYSGIMIQTQMRRYLATKHVAELRARYNHAAREIQRVYLGSCVRVQMKRLRAAKRIKKFMKRLHFFKFRDAVILIMSIRRMFRKRNLTAMMLQRVYRGYRGRTFVFYKKLWVIITKSMTRIVHRALRDYIRRYRDWKKKQCRWVRPSEEVLRAKLMKRLGTLLTNLVYQQRERAWQRQQLQAAMQPLQALARGYLARLGAKQLQSLRAQLRCWVTGETYEEPDTIDNRTSNNRSNVSTFGDRTASSFISTKQSLQLTKRTARTSDNQEQRQRKIDYTSVRAIDLVMSMIHQHRIVNYKIPSNVYISKSMRQSALLAYKHRANSTYSTMSALTSVAGDDLDAQSTSSSQLNITLVTTNTTDNTTVNPDNEFWFIRKYVPEPFCHWAEIDKKKHFLPALHRWYQDDQHLSLMTSEQTALVRRFTNRVNNKIMIQVLDMYIAQHPLPCRKHGRRVCGTCFYRRHCLLPSCHCQCYSNQLPPKKLVSSLSSVSSVDSGSMANESKDGKTVLTNTEVSLPSATPPNLGICVKCDHPINMHAICPLQYPKPSSSLSSNSSKKGKRVKNPTALLEAQLEYLTEEEVREKLQELRDAKSTQAVAVAPLRVDPSGASVGSMLSILNAQTEPDMSMPVGVYGVNADAVVIPALTYDDERIFNEKVESLQAKKLQRLLRQHFSGNQTATAKTTQGSALAKALKEQGISAAIHSPVIQSLTSTIRLKHTLLAQGTALRGQDSINNTSLGMDTSVANQVAEEVLQAAERVFQGASSHLLVKELATMQLEGDSIHLNNTYWEEDAMPSALNVTTENGMVRTHHQDFLQRVAVDSHVPEPRNPDWAKPSNPRFWEEVVAKNPNKSATDYNEGFEHNMPVPLLLPPKHRVGDTKELVYTFEGGKLYYNILWQIIQLAESVETQFDTQHQSQAAEDTKEEQDRLMFRTSNDKTNKSLSSKSLNLNASLSNSSSRSHSRSRLNDNNHNKSKPKTKKSGKISLQDVIHPDYPPFLSLVMNHIQIFERHWRKMVADLRTGALDRRLLLQGSVSQAAKTAFEATQIPRPALATQLDACFRALGFHKKVLGKDIEIQALAPKKSLRDKRQILRQVEIEAKKLKGDWSLEDEEKEQEQERVAALTRNNQAVAVSQSLSSLDVSQTQTMSAVSRPSSSSSSSSSVALEQDALLFYEAAVEERVSRTGQQSRSRRRSLPVAVEADTASRPVTALLLPPLTDDTKTRSAVSPPKASSVYHRGVSPDKTVSNRDLFLKSLTLTTDDTATQSNTRNTVLKSRNGRSLTHQEELFAQAITVFEPTNLAEKTLQLSSTQTLEPLPPRTSSSSPLKNKRRKSASQVQLPPSSALNDQQIHAIHYDLQTDARDKHSYTSLVKMSSTGRFLCPFPACGLTFLTAEVGFRHMQETHGQQTRLYAATPQTDAMFRFYWPKVSSEDATHHATQKNKKNKVVAHTPDGLTSDANNPFQIHTKQDGLALPAGSVMCPVPSCRGHTFATRTKWEAHLRMVHHLYPFAHEKHRFWVAVPDPQTHPDSGHALHKNEEKEEENANEKKQEEAFHVTAAMQQQTFHRHGGAKVLKTIPPDHSQPLFDDDTETHEFEALESLYGSEVFVQPMSVSSAVTVSPTKKKAKNTGKNTGNKHNNSTGNKLAALKHRATHGFDTSRNKSVAGVATPSDTTLLHPLVHILRQDPRYYAGIGTRKVLPSYCATHQQSSGHCLTCLHADADYDTHRDTACTAAQLQQRTQQIQLLTSRNGSVYTARPHAPYTLHYAVTLSLTRLAQTFQKCGLTLDDDDEEAAENDSSEMRNGRSVSQRHTTANTTANTTAKVPTVSFFVNTTKRVLLPPLLRHALPVSQSVCLLHGDDRHVLLVQRDLYTRHSVDVFSVLPPALRHSVSPPAPQVYRDTSHRLHIAAQWPRHFLVRPVFLLQDRDTLGWIGCEPVFTPAQLWLGDTCDPLHMPVSYASLMSHRDTGDTVSSDNTDNNSSKMKNNVPPPCVRLFDRDTGEDLTPQLCASVGHELLTATALLTQYDTRVSEADKERCRGVSALLSSPERLLWLPMHCVAAAFHVSYLSAPESPSSLVTDGRRQQQQHQPAATASVLSGDSSYQRELAEAEARLRDEQLTPLARWVQRQEEVRRFLSLSGDGVATNDNDPLVPSMQDIAPARFFIRI